MMASQEGFPWKPAVLESVPRLGLTDGAPVSLNL